MSHRAFTALALQGLEFKVCASREDYYQLFGPGYRLQPVKTKPLILSQHMSRLSQRAQYPSIKEYGLNYIPIMIYAIFLNEGVLGSLGLCQKTTQ